MNNKKIKVLFRLQNMEVGGVQKVAVNLFKNLNHDKFEITLLLNVYEGKLLNEIPKDIKIIYIVKGKEFFPKNKISYYYNLIYKNIKQRLLNYFPKFIFKQIITEHYDIDIAFGAHNFHYILQSPDKKSKKIAWNHGEIFLTSKEQKSQYWNLLNSCDVSVFVSEKTRNNFDKFYNNHLENGIVIKNPIDYSDVISKSKEFEVKYEKRPVFISVGRLSYEKGYDLLIDIHYRLLKEGYNHSIVIIGGGYEKEVLYEKLIPMGLKDTFLLYGEKDNPYPYIKAADYYIQPSRSEAYPLVIAEALILKKPIISTNVGGIPEMIENGVNGITVNFDFDEIYNSMLAFITDKKLVENIINQNDKNELIFDNQKIYKQIETLLLQQNE